jgi:hypothetical protein
MRHTHRDRLDSLNGEDGITLPAVCRNLFSSFNDDSAVGN